MSRMGSGIVGGIKGAFRGETIKIGAGVVLSTVLTKLTLSYFTAAKKDATGAVVKDSAGNTVVESTLPLGNDPMGPLLYLTLIPVVGGVILRRWSPAVAQGMIIGGIVNALNLTVTPMIDQEVAKLQSKVSGSSAFLYPLRGSRGYLPGSGSNRGVARMGNFQEQTPLFNSNPFAPSR